MTQVTKLQKLQKETHCTMIKITNSTQIASCKETQVAKRNKLKADTDCITTPIAKWHKLQIDTNCKLTQVAKRHTVSTNSDKFLNILGGS